MKFSILCLVVGTALVFTGCENGKPGGPGATNPPAKGPGLAEDTFTVDPPTLSTKIKQGETKNVAISIKRGKNFGEDVALQFSDLPKGVTFDPASPTIKQSEKEVHVNVMATNDAALGDFTVKVNGHPAKGPDATNEMKLTVEKK